MADAAIVTCNNRRGTYVVPQPTMESDGNTPIRPYSWDAQSTNLRGKWMHSWGSSGKAGDSYDFSWTSNGFTKQNNGKLFYATSSGDGFGFSTSTLKKEDIGFFYGEPDTKNHSNSSVQSTECRYMRSAIGAQAQWSAPDNTDNDKTNSIRLQDLGFVYNRVNDNTLYYAAMVRKNSWTADHSVKDTSPLSGKWGKPSDYCGMFNCTIPQEAIDTIRAAEVSNPYYLTGIYFSFVTDKDGAIRTKGMRFFDFKILTEEPDNQHPSNTKFVYPGPYSWDNITTYSRHYYNLN